MKKIQRIFLKLCSSVVFLLPSLVLAQATLQNPLQGPNSDNLFAIIDAVVGAILQLGAVLAVIAIIYAGFLFVTAGGDEKKVSLAKSVLLYTVIGIAILLGARIIANVVKTTVENVGKAAT